MLAQDRFPLPPPLPKLDFFFFSVTQQEAHCLSPLAETLHGESERGEETFRLDPDTLEGCLRVKMGGDPH